LQRATKIHTKKSIPQKSHPRGAIRAHSKTTDTMLTSSFTGVRVASARTQSSKKINTEISARRTKASAPAKKSALKVRERRCGDAAYLSR
jgi:hypothetical protein